MPKNLAIHFIFQRLIFFDWGVRIFLRDDLEQVGELTSYSANRVRTGAQTGREDAVKLTSTA
jgi:hypothetical protein